MAWSGGVCAMGATGRRCGAADAIRMARARVKRTFGTVPAHEAWAGAMRRAVCPGSFDPVTNGHLDIVGRASQMFDEVVVAVLINQSKAGLFTVEERLEMLSTVVAPCANVRVDAFQGLLVDFCQSNDIGAIVKGVLVAGDFDY